MGCSSLCTKKEEFEIVKNIGNKNNICHSYLIRSKTSKEEFAYKRIDISGPNNKEKKGIINDTKILQELNHPNVILLIDSYPSENNKFLNVISEYADGGDLQTKIDEQKKKNEYIKEDLLLNWFMQICLALRYIHKKKRVT